jgi:CubicO group peptidase (beta-lactamase class C family)
MAALAQGPAKAADPPGPPVDGQALAARLGQRLRTLAGGDRFSGEMLVGVEGRVVASERFGQVAARSEAEGPAIYTIASVTKTITAVGVLLLAQRGQLDTSSPLAKFFPEVDPGKLTMDGQPVILDHLLGHTSGLTGMRLFPAQIRARPEQAALRMISEAHLATTPGSRREYSNEGYVLLGEVIRRVSGKRYDQFVRDEIARPLQLVDTAIDLEPSQERRLVPGLMSSLLGLHQARSLIPHRLRHGDVWPGGAQGAVRSTTADLHRLVRGLVEERLLQEPWLRKMIYPERGQTRGLIVSLIADSGRRILWHNGATPQSAYQSFVGFIPDRSLIVVVLANVDHSALDLTDVVLDTVNGLPWQPPPNLTFDRIINTVRVLRVLEIGALLALLALWWCVGHPRRTRAEDVAHAAGCSIFVVSLLIEAGQAVFAAGCLSAVVLSGLILRRPPAQPWRWLDGHSAAAVVMVILVAVVLAGVLVMRSLF